MSRVSASDQRAAAPGRRGGTSAELWAARDAGRPVDCRSGSNARTSGRSSASRSRSARRAGRRNTAGNCGAAASGRWRSRAVGPERVSSDSRTGSAAVAGGEGRVDRIDSSGMRLGYAVAREGSRRAGMPSIVALPRDPVQPIHDLFGQPPRGVRALPPPTDDRCSARSRPGTTPEKSVAALPRGRICFCSCRAPTKQGELQSTGTLTARWFSSQMRMFSQSETVTNPPSRPGVRRITCVV